MSKNLAILGSTGSIGCQAVEVCLQLGLRVKGLTFNRNVEAVLPQIESLRPDLVATPDERAAFALAKRLRERGGDAPEILT
ncbi:MAG: 1-deoxy-D-xylulose-5-phosphate reductoisomerase, partial [Clostridiaceae bacterium]|nr:1-deoxy-D-xylulose-5-phosphate reductoisomerase [Clostridiaceae bacterium]